MDKIIYIIKIIELIYRIINKVKGNFVFRMFRRVYKMSQLLNFKIQYEEYEYNGEFIYID